MYWNNITVQCKTSIRNERLRKAVSPSLPPSLSLSLSVSLQDPLFPTWVWLYWPDKPNTVIADWGDWRTPLFVCSVVKRSRQNNFCFVFCKPELSPPRGNISINVPRPLLTSRETGVKFVSDSFLARRRSGLHCL